MSALSSSVQVTKRSSKSHGRAEDEDGLGTGEKNNIHEQLEGRKSSGKIGFGFDA